MSKINNFDVFKRMAEDNNQAMQLAPLGNLIGAKMTKAGTQVTLGVAGNVVTGLTMGTYVGGLILCGKEGFGRTKAKMEEELAQEVLDNA